MASANGDDFGSRVQDRSILRRRWRRCAVAVAVVAAVAIPITLRTGHRRAITVLSRYDSAAVTASPSGHLTNGQAVKVTVKGFPADQRVTLAECPNPTPIPGVPCSSAPAQGGLVTDRSGSASGTFVVEVAPASFTKVFGLPKCAPQCLLVVTSLPTSSTPAVRATTTLAFASLPVGPPATGNFPEPAGFVVVAASFVSADQGWAMGSTGCGGCVGVAHTGDGGRTWSYLPPPPTTLWWYSDRPSAVTDIDFANASDGYLFGPGLYATSDSGRTWSDQRLTGIASLTVDGSYVYALTGYNDSVPDRLYRSTLGTSTWEQVPLPDPSGPGRYLETASAGADLVLLEAGADNVGITPDQVGRIWVSSDRGADWQPRPNPCTVADGGAAVLSVAYGHPNGWLVDCFANQQSSQEQDTEQHLYGSSDGGRTWVRLGDPPQHDAPVLLADNGAGHAFLATIGATDRLNGTLDGGQSWPVTIRDDGSFSGWADLTFVSQSTGFFVGPTHVLTGHLYRTTNGGQTWTPLAVRP